MNSFYGQDKRGGVGILVREDLSEDTMQVQNFVCPRCVREGEGGDGNGSETTRIPGW